MISHIVLFEPKADLSESDYLLFAQQLNRTLTSVPKIARASIGRSRTIDSGVSRNFGDKTYSFSAVLEFESEQDLVGYLNHPEHIKLGGLFWRYCQATVVVEAETRDGLVEDVTEILVRQ